MRRKLIVIGALATVMAISGTAFIIPQLSITPGPAFKYVAWPVYLRVTLISIVFWLGVGSILIRKQSGVWSGLLAGLLSPVIGVVLVNPFFIFALGEAPLQFAAVGLTTGVLVWCVARSQGRWLREAA